jgi:hemerythrin HHE cation binding domain-containing protein
VGVRAAAEEVERALATASGGRTQPWSTEMASRTRRLLQAFDQHISATESTEGLFSEVIEDAPRLVHRVEQLQADHVAIREAITDLVGRTQAGAASDVDEVRELALELLGRISRHRHLGAELVYEAYTVDIEAAD